MKEPQVYMQGDAVEQSEVQSFEEEMDGMQGEYEERFLEEHLLKKYRGDYKEGDDMSNESFEKKKEDLENQYINRVVEASKKEYENWKERLVDRVLWGLSDERRSNAENKMLREVIKLYMTAKKRRKEIKGV